MLVLLFCFPFFSCLGSLHQHEVKCNSELFLFDIIYVSLAIFCVVYYETVFEEGYTRSKMICVVQHMLGPEIVSSKQEILQKHHVQDG